MIALQEIILRDAAIAARMLWRSRGFAAAAIGTLALGIGANTAIFSLVNKTLLEPLPYPGAERIIQLWLMNSNGGGVTLSLSEFHLLSQETSVFEDAAAYDFGGPGVNITGMNPPEQVKAIHVSAAYFRLFGARVELGRTFTTEEDRPNGGRYVVLSHALWTRRFGADRNLAGKTISLGNEPYVVTGVLASNFQPDPPAQIWLPLQADPNSTSQAHFIRIAARLRAGVSIDQANARLRLITAEFHRQFPLFNPSALFEAKPFRETTAGRIRTALLVLFGAVVMVLLIACSNVANLLLARAVARQREIAIRAAIGASRARLAAQLLVESALLSLAGAVVGVAAGAILLKTLLAFHPDVLPGAGSFRVADTLDWRVLTFAAILCVATTLLFGLLPALRASRADLSASMQEGGMRAGTGSRAMKTRSLIVVIQTALALLLLIGAGLMIRSFTILREVEPGIKPHRVLTLEMSLEGTKFKDTAAVTRLAAEGVERLKRVPGVMAAATTWTLPVELAFSSSFVIEGRPLGKDVAHGGALMRPVSPEYSSVFDIALLRGRFFTERDTAKSGAVAVISLAMARKFWPGADPIGRRITIDKNLGPDFAAAAREIIGIAGDVRDLAMNEDPMPIIYIPQAQVPNGMTAIDIRVLPVTWVVRTGTEPYSLSSAIQQALREASAGLPVARIRSMDDVIRHSTARSDFNALLLTIFAATSLLLAAIGLYGLIAFSVQQRTHEIGIRLALGARPDQVRGMILSHGLRLALTGVAAGTAASLALTGFMESLLYGVKPLNPPVIAAAAGTLALVAALAAYIPALRASRMDPAGVLHSA